MWDSESEATVARIDDNGVVSGRHSVDTDMFERRGQSWYVATDIPSDLLIQIGEISFHLHKCQLLSKSGRINRMICESTEIELQKVILDKLPGGAEAFELVAKFCYGGIIKLTAAVITGLRCAAEYLEMTEDLEEGNLIKKTEAFINYVMLSSWKDSISVLKSCEELSPWAENLQIVRRCSESVAWKASSEYAGKHSNNSCASRNQVLSDWWFEDVSVLKIDYFVRVITAIKVKGMKYELVGSAIMHYAMKWIPGMIKEGLSGSVEEGTSTKNGLHMIIAVNKGDHSSSPEGKRQRAIIESLISITPPQNDSVSCSFLLRLLRIATMVNVSPALVTELEKRVGMQLEEATMADLLIPSYNRSETMYDVDLVQRIFEHFLIREQMEMSSPGREPMSGKIDDMNAKMRVAKLIDGYLAEVSRDKNLSLTKFQVLAEALPESARSCDDGIYAAIDSYLKAHPMLSEHERRRLCRAMDVHKLSKDAYTHAAQNERLPLRVIVQVIFSEQMKLSTGLSKQPDEPHYEPIIQNRKTLLEETPQSFQDGWATAKKEISMLKFDLETVKTKYIELQHEMESLQMQYDSVMKLKQESMWLSGWKKLSKMTKVTTIENMGSVIVGSKNRSNIVEHTVKTPRRRRYSLS
ncbi:hypothetical protein LXL04_001446 [Taraxacum kok-saghyz]